MNDHQFYRLLRVILVAGAIAALALLANTAWGLEVPAGAIRLESHPLPCGGSTETYDTDGIPANGAEVHVLRTERGRILAIVRFGPGDDGRFLGAEVRLPGHPTRAFTTIPDLHASYQGDPCNLIRAAGQEV